jgi:BASS family bile acid:Na+ symporter
MNPERIAAMVLLVSFMLQIGLQVNVEQLLAALKNYRLLARAFVANFLLVPLFGVALVRVIHLDPMVAVGVLLMAIAPGVPFLPKTAGHARGGSLGFALCLAFLMPALSTITVPLTARIVLPTGAETHVPLASFIVNLVVFQLVPLLFGLLIAQRAPALAEKLVRPLLVVFVLCILVVLIAVSPVIGRSFATVTGSRGLITALALVLLSIAAGWVLGGPDASYRRTLSISTAMRNVGLASLVATVNFPGTAAAAAAMCYFIIQLIVVMIAGRFFARSLKTPGAPATATG